VGIVISGQLVEERVFAVGRAVTFGQSLRCDLSVPVDGLPREHVLFAPDGTLSPPLGAEVVGSRARGKVTVGEVTILFQEVATPVASPRMQLPASLRSSLADRIDPESSTNATVLRAMRTPTPPHQGQRMRPTAAICSSGIVARPSQPMATRISAPSITTS
jgi:hypothetical protein